MCVLRAPRAVPPPPPPPPLPPPLPPRSPGIPWCYFKEGEGIFTPETCAAASSSRKECANPGKKIDEKICHAKGCCWMSGEPGQPWCFYPAGSGEQKPKAPPAPKQPAATPPPMPTPRFIRPTLPPPGWVPGGISGGKGAHSEL
jgi:hypothetical protein